MGLGLGRCGGGAGAGATSSTSPKFDLFFSIIVFREDTLVEFPRL